MTPFRPDVRDTIYGDIYDRFWNAGRRAFIQHPGVKTLDFVSPTDPRWISTLRAIERELISDSLVYRYRLDDRFSDGLTGQEARAVIGEHGGTDKTRVMPRRPVPVSTEDGGHMQYYLQTAWNPSHLPGP